MEYVTLQGPTGSSLIENPVIFTEEAAFTLILKWKPVTGEVATTSTDRVFQELPVTVEKKASFTALPSTKSVEAVTRKLFLLAENPFGM
jgi:hypothetical protein